MLNNYPREGPQAMQNALAISHDPQKRASSHQLLASAGNEDHLALGSY